MTPLEARITHGFVVLLGLAFAVIGYLSQHKGVALPIGGMTVGGAMTTVSSWRFLKTIEHTVDMGESYAKRYGHQVSSLRQVISEVMRLLPENIQERLASVEQATGAAVEQSKAAVKAASAAAAKPISTDDIVKQVLAAVASLAAPAPVEPTATVVKPRTQVMGIIDQGQAAPQEPAPNAAPQASPFQNPPVVAG